MHAEVKAEDLARRIRLVLPNVKVGTLRFWGEWFGRPYDNLHQIINSTSSNNILYLHFNEQEILSIWDPRNIVVGAQVFRISDASRVRWEWYSYGEPKTPENRYFEDFIKSPKGIEWTTNIDWYKPEFHPKASEPAMEIV